MQHERAHAYVHPDVHAFVQSVQDGLRCVSFARTRDARGPSWTRVDYLLHAHAGHVTARPADQEALDDLRAVLARRTPAIHAGRASA